MSSISIGYIGIDVGKSGGVCFIYKDKGTPLPTMHCYKCPTTIHDMADLIATPPIKELPNIKWVGLVERVHSMPKQGVRSMFTFGENYGHWVGILAALKISYNLITPLVWMKHYTPIPKDKKDRKNYLKSVAQRLYPDSHITLATADAILIAHYLMITHHTAQSSTTDQ